MYKSRTRGSQRSHRRLDFKFWYANSREGHTSLRSYAYLMRTLRNGFTASAVGLSIGSTRMTEENLKAGSRFCNMVLAQEP
jgi:hypothetical protein